MRKIVPLFLICALAISPAYARKKSAAQELEGAVTSMLQPGSFKVPATGEIEVAFSPNEGAEKLVIKTIDSARSSIRLMAYSFTSAAVVSALLHAKKRGVDVAMVVDSKGNMDEDRSGKATAALSTLATAGVSVRTISIFAIAHDKTIIVDEATVETGSYNFTSSAATRNSENVIVHWNNPQLAAVYLKHFERNWKQGVDFKKRY
ncbi:phospholipase D family nuclease [Noviherbaspirillum galbum]|uniref:phospholipase D n=1 Tax=Noviherbaspirillum galbum TaxID=2709383 RepID=A0A6B3SH13_9BURK|nr:phospholipase D family protein [Noviherbaspirillum galbum]NEX60167.1 phospholipase D family protein [Noviherbaspirillum galbum]